MVNKYAVWTLVAGLGAGLNAAHADEITLKSSDNTEMSVSIYNQNLALIRDIRKADLSTGKNEIAFEGVAQQMKPETAILKAAGAKVLEQNYEYDLLNAQNIMEEAIGQEVKTVTVNPANGENIFDKAIVVNSNYGSPLLKFSYGYEANFPGRVIFENLPENLRIKPTLAAKIEADKGGNQEITLNYLTTGLSWQADYVAEIDGNNNLNLQGWITLNNQSGADYKNTSVQLISGQVRQEAEVRPIPRALGLKTMAYAASMDNVAESASLQAQNLAEYYVYTLPFKTDIMDKQSKQVSLLEKNAVKFERIYRLKSPLYMGPGNGNSEFENAHPALLYKLVNRTEDNLGLPLPMGTVRFYEKDDKGMTEFTGAADMTQLPVGAKAELAVGDSFDIYADGKVTNVNKLGDKLYEISAEVTFHNAKDSEQVVEFEQSFYGSVEVTSESETSDKNKARNLKWKIKIPAKGKNVLTYKVRMARN